jgi:Domain of unknown function (DUF4340)
MIRKSTLLVLLIALLLGGAVYYFDWKRGEKEKEKPADDSSKLAFSFQAADVASFTLSHPAKPDSPPNALQKPIVFEKKDGVWQIVQPVVTQADSSSAETIASDTAAARISGTEPGSPDRLKAFNLDPPQLVLDVKLQNGAKHTIQFGDRDFNGTSAYAIIDGAKEVSLLPFSLLATANKSLDDLRDHSVLHFVAADAASFALKNSSGELAASKEKSLWTFSKPAGKLADNTDVMALLNSVSTAKMSVVAETSDDLAKYGLAHPEATFTTVDSKAKSSTLFIGKKEGSGCFARDASRPQIFRMNDAICKEFSEGYADLRDKQLAHIDAKDVNRIEVHNSNGDAVFTRKAGKDAEEDWTVESPDEQKGKTVGSWKFFTPTVEAHADAAFDQPPPKVAAGLAKPAVTVVLTTAGGKKLTLSFSAPIDGATYARSSDAPTIYKLNKKIFDNLDFKTKDLVF